MLFLSLDGGCARECSEEWAFMTHRASDRNVRYKGISNLNSGMFKSFTDDFKMRVFKAALESNRNLIIPDTCATPLPGLPSNMNFMIQELKSHGYNIVMTAVSASKEKCRQNGTNREMKEGKKYSSLSWSFAVDKIPVCFRHVRELGYTQQTFFVTENTNWNKPRTLLVPPQYSVKVAKHNEVTKASHENRPSYSAEESTDRVPHFTLYCMPPSDFTNMHRIFRSDVRLKVISNNDTKSHKTSLQICTHGRSLWMLWFHDVDHYHVLNDRCSVIRGESPDADYILQSEKEKLAEDAKKRSRWRARKQSMEDSKDDPRENIFIIYLREETPASLIRRANSSESSSLPLPTISDDEDEVCLIVRCSNKSERDQWIDTIKGGLFSVRSSTVETLKQTVNEYLESSARERMTFIALRKYIVDRFGQVTFDINSDICEALVKRYLVTMA